MWHLAFQVCVTSLIIIISSSILLATNFRVSFSLQLSSIPLCICTNFKTSFICWRTFNLILLDFFSPKQNKLRDSIHPFIFFLPLSSIFPKISHIISPTIAYKTCTWTICKVYTKGTRTSQGSLCGVASPAACCPFYLTEVHLLTLSCIVSSGGQRKMLCQLLVVTDSLYSLPEVRE